jgi:NAD(P)-dependent dehydrogenase (short-subunit alcohol dehydrogenase family)
MAEQALANRTVVIIGGTSGLGLAAARACRAAGAHLVVVGKGDTSAAASELGPTVRVLSGDATHSATAPLAIQTAIDAFGSFDALYHVAGGSGRSKGDGPLHELTDDGWDHTLRLNLDSVFHSNRAAARQFLAQKTGGSVLNVTSVLAFSPSPRYFSTHAYAAAKGAIIALTRSAAARYAPDSIRFNAIASGLARTPMSARASNDAAIMRFIATKQPLDGGRIGEATDLDAAVVFLLSEASRFITGQVIAVDGGWSVSEGQYESTGAPDAPQSP